MKIVIEVGSRRAIVKEDDVHGAFQDIGGGIVAAQGYGTPPACGTVRHVWLAGAETCVCGQRRRLSQDVIDATTAQEGAFIDFAKKAVGPFGPESLARDLRQEFPL